MFLSTGIAALDARITGFLKGRYYFLSGMPGAGKTSAALQFLAAGLEKGESCAILTQEDPSDIVAHAAFLGYDLRGAEESGKLLIIRFRLDFNRNFVRAENEDAVFHELEEHLKEVDPTRLVIDTVLPFLDGGRASQTALTAFQRFLERRSETSLLILPGVMGQDHYTPIYESLVAGMGGLLEFELKQEHAREIHIRKLRHELISQEPLCFSIRQGAGIVETLSREGLDALALPVLRRVVLLDTNNLLPAELRYEVETSFDAVGYDSVEAAFAELVSGRFGALVVTVDPLAPESALGFIRNLRSAGNGVPILPFSKQKGLRATTRTRALSAGADDFLTDTLSPEEFLHRIRAAQDKGHRRNLEPAVNVPTVLQPRDDAGQAIALSEAEFQQGILQQMEVPHSIFGVALLWPGKMDLESAWRLLSVRLRTMDGDLVAVLPNGQIGLYLHNIRRTEIHMLLGRLNEAYPTLLDLDSVNLFCFPHDRTELEAWTGSTVELAVGASS